MSEKTAGSGSGSGSASRAIVVTVLAVLAGIAAVYVTLGRPDNARPPQLANAPGSAPRAEPAASATRDGAQTAAPAPGRLNSGEMAAFVFKKEPEALADVAFADGKGQALTLGHWKGRVVLLNLWATWCGPCRKEMPALSRLQRELGSAKFEVVALAVDRAGADAAAKFLGSIDARDLALYIDTTARSGSALKAAGMPTTLLIDATGKEVGRLTGAAEWDSADAKRLIGAYLN